jgi:hypothetical protein
VTRAICDSFIKDGATFGARANVVDRKDILYTVKNLTQTLQPVDTRFIVPWITAVVGCSKQKLSRIGFNRLKSRIYLFAVK